MEGHFHCSLTFFYAVQVFRRSQTRQWFGAWLMSLGRRSRTWNSLSTGLEEDYVNLYCRQTGAKLNNIPLRNSGKIIQIIGEVPTASVKGFYVASFLPTCTQKLESFLLPLSVSGWIQFYHLQLLKLKKGLSSCKGLTIRKAAWENRCVNRLQANGVWKPLEW